MAIEVWAFTVLVPAGTQQATPANTHLTMPPRQVEEIEIVVPPGNKGNLGFRLGVSGFPILPVNAGSFLVTDNEKIRWSLLNLPNSGDWTLSAYNLGLLDHTLYLRFLVSLPGGQGLAAAPSFLEPVELAQ